MGVILGVTETVIVVGLAHAAGLGVKVYILVAFGLTGGDQVPEIPFKEVVGRVKL